jgi:hypothetical protein
MQTSHPNGAWRPSVAPRTQGARFLQFSSIYSFLAATHSCRSRQPFNAIATLTALLWRILLAGFRARQRNGKLPEKECSVKSYYPICGMQIAAPCRSALSAPKTTGGISQKQARGVISKSSIKYSEIIPNLLTGPTTWTARPCTAKQLPHRKANKGSFSRFGRSK